MGACLSGRSLNGSPFSEIYDSNEMVNRRKQVLSNLKVYTLAGCEVAGPGFLLCHSYITFLPGQGSGDRGFDRRGRAPFSHGVTDEFFR